MQRSLKPFLMVNTCTRSALLTKESHACILIVAEQVRVMDFALELMDSEEAMVTLTVPHSVSDTESINWHVLFLFLFNL